MNKYIMNFKFTLPYEMELVYPIWHFVIFADSDKEALEKAKDKLYEYQNPLYLPIDTPETIQKKHRLKEEYENCIVDSIFSIESIEIDYNPFKKYDTISSNNTEDEPMEELYNFMIWGDYNKKMEELANKII